MGDSIELLARVVWRVDGRVLVCRNRKRGYCFLPGGHVEFGESAGAAAIRELSEEAGLVISLSPPTAVFEMTFRQQGRLRHEVTVVFHVAQCNTEPSSVSSREPAIAFEWVEVDRLEVEGFVPRPQLEWLLAPQAGGFGRVIVVANESIPDDYGSRDTGTTAEGGMWSDTTCPAAGNSVGFV
ncbi:MAG: NUDIX domain-containing protein [Phycisphaerales bacterium]